MFSDWSLILRRVTQLVTKDITPKLHEATGISPSIQMMEIIKEIHNQLKKLDRNISGIGTSKSRAVQEGIEQNDDRSGLLVLTTMEQELEKMMNKIDEKFKAASSLLPDAIDDELEYDVSTGGVDTNGLG